MGFQDRRYTGGSGGGGYDGGGGDLAWRIWRALNYSFGIGTYLGVRVRVHIFFVIFVALELFRHQSPMWTLRWMALLFGSVLLHEYGHALACRAVGGRADDILLWPLGGLAYCDPPHRPWSEFVTVICGPLVNVALLGIAALTLFLTTEQMPISFNPFAPYTGYMWTLNPFGELLADLFVVNYLLFLFNMLLVFYPFDGGRIVQIALWTRVGYEKSLYVATTIGMVGAVGIVIWGLAVQRFLLVLIGAFGFYTCYQQKAYLQQAGPDYGRELGDMYVATKPKGPGVWQRWRNKRKRQQIDRAAEQTQAMDAEVDRILEKVHRDGIHSLSAKEKRTLQQATEKQRGG